MRGVEGAGGESNQGRIKRSSASLKLSKKKEKNCLHYCVNVSFCKELCVTVTRQKKAEVRVGPPECGPLKTNLHEAELYIPQRCTCLVHLASYN
jgi:hypothetical protein